MPKSRFRILIKPEKCVGCLICALRCSLRFEKAFNPSKALIEVVSHFGKDNRISFSDKCDNCGICARYCPYGALILEGIGGA